MCDEKDNLNKKLREKIRANNSENVVKNLRLWFYREL
jgi:hypothetical protein